MAELGACLDRPMRLHDLIERKVVRDGKVGLVR